MGKILIYTRTPVPELYSSHLAYSAHLAYSMDGAAYKALNRNYGILFASATINSFNSLNEKGLKKPYLFKLANGGFGVVAVRINADGSDDEESIGKVLLWTSEDLFYFREIGLLDLKKKVYVQEAACEYDLSTRMYVINWKDGEGNLYKNTLPDINNLCSIFGPGDGNAIPYPAVNTAPQGAVTGNELEIEDTLGAELLIKWSPLENIGIKVPELIKAAKAEDVNSVLATAVYNDGSEASKRVIWNTDKIDFSKASTYELKGIVTQEAYPFPLASGYADPAIIKWEDRYYFIATNDNTDDVGLYVREGDTVHDLFKKATEEHIILDKDEVRGFVQTFWAPEFHVINSELYILFAVSGSAWGPQSHLMKLKKNGSIIDPGSWEAPVRIIKQDGTYLATEGITLDMTYFKADNTSYLVWSYRLMKSGLSTADDTGSMLLIATIDPARPWQLTSEPVLLSRPLLGWENNERTINNEGPFAIVTEEKVFLTYSGGAAGGYTYVLGLLTANIGEDLLNPDSWIKDNAPALSYYSVKGEYGPGHNTFFRDEQGNLMIAYHAQETMQRSPRCTAIRRVHFNKSGIPVFDLSAERDLKPELASVKTKLVIEK